MVMAMVTIVLLFPCSPHPITLEMEKPTLVCCKCGWEEMEERFHSNVVGDPPKAPTGITSGACSTEPAEHPHTTTTR